MLVKRDEASKKSVMILLQRINDTLASKATRFLTGETLCCFDCELMPKLQHIRVAGKFFVDFHIPEEMTHLWRYIREMYQLDAFTQSCPADQVYTNNQLFVYKICFQKNSPLTVGSLTHHIDHTKYAFLSKVKQLGISLPSLNFLFRRQR